MKPHLRNHRGEESPISGTTLSVTSPESTEDSLGMCWPASPGPSQQESPRPGSVLPEEEDDAFAAARARRLLHGSSSPSSSRSSWEYQSFSPGRSRGAEPEPDAGPQRARALYTHVRTVRGVAVAWETEAGFQPVSRQPRVREAEFVRRERRRGSSFEAASSTDLRWELEAGAQPDEPAPQAPDGAPAPGPLELRPPPDWLVSPSRGLRCVACCRVFPTLAALLDHAQHGVRDGFSCQIFFEEMLERRKARELEQDRQPGPEPRSGAPGEELPAQQQQQPGQ